MASSKKTAARRARPTRVAKKAAKVTPRSPRPPDVVQATGASANANANANAIAAAESAANELRYLQARRIEDLAQGFVSLTSELWIVKDRLAVLEQVLDRHGIPAPSAVDAYTPEGEFKTRLDAERRAWAQRMIAALFPRGLPKVE